MGASSDPRIEDVSVTAVWERLRSNAASVLVDVRTRAEWTYVGIPDLSSLGKQPLLMEWQTYPDGTVEPGFAANLATELASRYVDKNAEIFFICRSGARSKAAAQALAQAGYERCRNVADGFEGPLDPSRKRGRQSGWKAAGLAWVQG